MQNCRAGHIIGNSTFAWWAAYIASVKSDFTLPVVCPEQWFVDPEKQQCEALKCDGWHVIQAACE